MRPTINKNCLNCNKIFAAQIRYVKNGAAKFCSVQCTGKYKSKTAPKKKHNAKCAWCNKSFYKKPSKMKGSKSGLFFCERKHKDLAQRMTGLSKLQPKHYGISSKHDKTRPELYEFTHRRKAFKALSHKCNKCNYNEYVQLLEVHHKDKDHNNNDIINLEILCVMCHKKYHYGLK